MDSISPRSSISTHSELGIDVPKEQPKSNFARYAKITLVALAAIALIGILAAAIVASHGIALGPLAFIAFPNAAIISGSALGVGALAMGIFAWMKRTPQESAKIIPAEAEEASPAPSINPQQRAFIDSIGPIEIAHTITRDAEEGYDLSSILSGTKPINYQPNTDALRGMFRQIDGGLQYTIVDEENQEVAVPEENLGLLQFLKEQVGLEEGTIPGDHDVRLYQLYILSNQMPLGLTQEEIGQGIMDHSMGVVPVSKAESKLRLIKEAGRVTGMVYDQKIKFIGPDMVTTLATKNCHVEMTFTENPGSMPSIRIRRTLTD